MFLLRIGMYVPLVVLQGKLPFYCLQPQAVEFEKGFQ